LPKVGSWKVCDSAIKRGQRPHADRFTFDLNHGAFAVAVTQALGNLVAFVFKELVFAQVRFKVL
jgi:hypothetical protein